MAFERFWSILLHEKTAPIITLLTAIISFVLSLIALLATAQKGGLAQYGMVMLNTSTVLQNLVKVESGTSSVAARAVQILPQQTPIPTTAAVLDARQFSLPSPSQVTSFLGSIGGDISSAISPQSTGTSSGSASSDLESLLNQLIGDVTASAGNEVVQVINKLIKDVVTALGIKDWYGIYVTGYCAGDYTASNGMDTSSCNSYNKLEKKAPNSTVQLGTTTLDFSALNIPAKLSQTGTSINTIFTTLLAFQITGIVAAGLLILLTPFPLLISFFRRPFIHLIIFSLVALASITFIASALLASTIQIAVSSIINSLGDGLGVEAYGGGSFLALAWISAVLMGYASIVWFVRWHSRTYMKRGKELGKSQRPLVKTTESNWPSDRDERGGIQIYKTGRN